MGNGVGKLTVCFTGAPLDTHRRRRVSVSALLPDPLDDSLGHSFYYVRPDPSLISSSKVHSEEPTTVSAAAAAMFRLSGASVSANTATPLSTADPFACAAFTTDRSSAFESSNSFAAIPLQPIPRGSVSSGPLIPGSGPMERGFLSGPIERGFMSGPLDRGPLFSGPLDKSNTDDHYFRRSFSHGFKLSGSDRKTRSIIGFLQKAISKTILPRRQNNSIVAPLKHVLKDPDWMLTASEKQQQNSNDNLLTVSSSEGSVGLDDESFCLEKSQNLQWAQGRAGEDRVHVVVSEEHGWVFVGIYDGFNGPDAPDFLSSNLYAFVHKELKGLLWDDVTSNGNNKASVFHASDSSVLGTECTNREKSEMDRNEESERENNPCPSGEYASLDWNLRRKKSKNSKGRYRGGVVGKKWGDTRSRWKCEWDRERIELDKRLKEQRGRNGDLGAKGSDQDQADVLAALSRALRKTEEAYLDAADKILAENPELALMGSCVLVMLMKGEDVYVMNVGDSRAVLAQKAELDYGVGKIMQDLERINEETLHDLQAFDDDWLDSVPKLNAFQLSVDHSTNMEEEVRRIKSEHPDDASAILNDRVKGSLKVTRAFGAGFLKQPKWNDALLEMFRIDYIGNAPYLTCSPSLHHHRLGLKDRFLILSSDGLYQYLTNEEAVYEVGLFLTLQPEGDPAQHLVEEVLFRAAKRAGMDFHELLEIPQGDRRRYHDDISIVVISLEGRIWRSFV